jgi:hypothetical protein
MRAQMLRTAISAVGNSWSCCFATRPLVGPSWTTRRLQVRTGGFSSQALLKCNKPRPRSFRGRARYQELYQCGDKAPMRSCRLRACKRRFPSIAPIQLTLPPHFSGWRLGEVRRRLGLWTGIADALRSKRERHLPWRPDSVSVSENDQDQIARHPTEGSRHREITEVDAGAAGKTLR